MSDKCSLMKDDNCGYVLGLPYSLPCVGKDNVVCPLHGEKKNGKP